MAVRRFPHGITFNVSDEIRNSLDRLSIEHRKNVSEILRLIIKDYLATESKNTLTKNVQSNTRR